MSTEGGILYGQWERIAVSFKDDTWDVIAKAVKSNDYPYKVGDTKTITLDGFGEHTVRVANVSECTNGETSETACGFVVEFADIITTYYMNSTDTNVGGYPASSMYSYLNTTIYNSIPQEIRNVMIDTTVVSGHGYSDSSNFTTTDKLYLLGAEEVWTDTSQYNSATNASKQLDYYKNNGVIAHSSTNTYSIKNYNDSSAGYWWLRSANSNDTTHYWMVQNVGSSYITNWHGAVQSDGISPAFRIG